MAQISASRTSLFGAGTRRSNCCVFWQLISKSKTNRRNSQASRCHYRHPCTPSKIVAMVDNFHALVTKLEHAVPAEPLYFLKGNNSFLAANQVIRTPKSYTGKVVYEGELGIVIGQHIHEATEAEAAQAIFGYTCINDVTAIEILNRDPGYAQWTRSKSFNTFGVLAPTSLLISIPAISLLKQF